MFVVLVCHGIRGKGMALSLRAGVFPCGINAPDGGWVPDGQMRRMV